MPAPFAWSGWPRPWHDGARLALLQPLFWLVLCRRCMERHSRLIHSDNVVQHCHRLLLDRRQELLAGPHPILFLVWIQKPRHPPSRLLYKPKAFVDDGMDSCWSSSMAAVTEMMTSGTRVLFFGLRCLWWMVVSPALTFFKMA
jgi:hypothetical protein